MRRALFCVSVLAVTFLAACADSTAPSQARVVAPSGSHPDVVSDPTCRNGFSVANGRAC